MFGAGIGVAALLIASGFGYIIRLKAEDAKGDLQILGMVIAYIIMIVSILSAACQLYTIHTSALTGKSFYCCPMCRGMMQQPMMQRQMIKQHLMKR